MSPSAESPPRSRSRTRGGLAPLDAILLSYIGAVCALIAARAPDIPHAPAVLLLHAGIGAAAVLLARWTRTLSEGADVLARAAFAFAAVPVLFLALGWVVPHVQPLRFERELKAIDDALFLGRNPNVLLDRIATPALTEYLQLVYACFYFLPLVLLAPLVRRRDWPAIEKAADLIVLTLLLSYLGYFAVPATSPAVNRLGLYDRWPPYEEELRSGTSSLPGLAFADAIRAALFRAEAIQLDCFPSGHVAMSLALLAAARRLHRGAFRVLLVPVLSLVFSTVYLRYHYAVDVLAGAALAWIALALAPRLEAAFDKFLGSRRRFC